MRRLAHVKLPCVVLKDTTPGAKAGVCAPGEAGPKDPGRVGLARAKAVPFEQGCGGSLGVYPTTSVIQGNFPPLEGGICFFWQPPHPIKMQSAKQTEEVCCCSARGGMFEPKVTQGGRLPFNGNACKPSVRVALGGA